MVKSCGVVDAEAFAENEVMSFVRSCSPELQPVSTTARANTIPLRSPNWRRTVDLIIMASSWFPPLGEVVRVRAGTKRAPGDRRVVCFDNCARHRENQAGLLRHVCRRIR